MEEEEAEEDMDEDGSDWPSQRCRDESGKMVKMLQLVAELQALPDNLAIDTERIYLLEVDLHVSIS